MTPKDFVEGIYEELNSSLASYADIYVNTDLKEKSDSFYKRAIPFFRTLDEKDQETFFEIIRQIEIDRTATILALIDGVFLLKNQESNLKLISKGDSEETIISGDLSNLFLELIEIQETENNL